jgi:hypothetical protein
MVRRQSDMREAKKATSSTFGVWGLSGFPKGQAKGSGYLVGTVTFRPVRRAPAMRPPFAGPGGNQAPGGPESSVPDLHWAENSTRGEGAWIPACPNRAPVTYRWLFHPEWLCTPCPALRGSVAVHDMARLFVMSVTRNVAWDGRLEAFKGRDTTHYVLTAADLAKACAAREASQAPFGSRSRARLPPSAGPRPYRRVCGAACRCGPAPQRKRMRPMGSPGPARVRIWWRPDLLW